LTSLYPLVGGYAKSSFLIAKNTPLYASTSWQVALEWMKKNLPSNAVIAANWDYGSHINVLANKATIIDEDHYIPYWIYLFNRHVLCAQTETEALQFLKMHGATHLVISDGNIHGFNIHSYLGSNETLDRYVVPVPLVQTSQNDDSSKIYLAPEWSPNIDIEIEGKTYASHEWFLKQVVLEFEPNSDDKTKALQIKGVYAIVNTKEKSFKLPLNIQGEKISTESDFFPGGFSVFQIEDEQKEGVKKWQAVYLPEVGHNALAIKLYLRQIETPHFKLVYSNSVDSLSQGVKVWEIIYPPNLEPNPAYLETEFKPKELYRSWMLGESKRIIAGAGSDEIRNLWTAPLLGK